jgi:hypothetical protein
MMLSLLPFAAWKYGPAWLHPVLIAVAVLLLIITGVSLYRYIVRERKVTEDLLSRSEYLWPDGWDVRRYHRVLLTYLKVDDWHVRSAEAVDADRLLLFIQRERHRFPMLLLRPGLEPSEADIARLRSEQARDDTWEAVLVSDTPPRAQAAPDDSKRTLLMIDYDTLPWLAEALEGGPEEERRAVAAKRMAAEAVARKAKAKAARAESGTWV